MTVTNANKDLNHRIEKLEKEVSLLKRDRNIMILILVMVFGLQNGITLLRLMPTPTIP